MSSPLSSVKVIAELSALPLIIDISAVTPVCAVFKFIAVTKGLNHWDL